MLHSYDKSVDSDLIDMQAYSARANEILSVHDNRTKADWETVLQTRKSLSSIAGVAELNTLEGEYFNLAIYRDSPVLDFVEMRNLPVGTLPFYRTRYSPATGFFAGSINAMGSTYYYATQDAGQTVTPFTIQSDEIMVPNLHPIYDMEKLQQRAEALKRLAIDMNIAIVNANLNTVFGATNVVTTDPAAAIVSYFGTGGAFGGKNVYVLDPGVQPGSVPAVNVYDLTAENGLTKKVYQQINDWSILMGRTVRKIYVPSASVGGYPVWRAMQDQAAIVALTTGQGNQNPGKAVTADSWAKFQRDDYRSVVGVDWFGLNVDIERQNWLPAGYCLVLTDQPASIMWDRLHLETGEDRVGTLEVPVTGYMSRRSEARNIATVRPDFLLRNFMVIKVQ
jgi:hypothetical protein